VRRVEMAIDVIVSKTKAMTVAFVSKKGPYSQLNETFPRLYDWLRGKGFEPAGPPSGVYFNSPEQVPAEELMWEVRCPIGGDVAPSGPDEQGFGVKRVEAVDIACTMHKGPFDQVGVVYDALFGWIMENGYEIAGPSEEVYLTDPAYTPPAELLTEVRFPVRKK
jgi:effector-binding domain-containing protein